MSTGPAESTCSFMGEEESVHSILRSLLDCSSPAQEGVCEPPKAGAPPGQRPSVFVIMTPFTLMVAICDFEHMPELWAVGMLGTVGSLSLSRIGPVPACACTGRPWRREKRSDSILGVLMAGLGWQGWLWTVL